MPVCTQMTGTYLAVEMRGCDPDYWTICGPDVNSDACSPEVNSCAPDYGDDGCLPDCGPNE